MNKSDLLKTLRQTVGEKFVIDDPKELQVWGCDWTRQFKPNPLCAVLPANTQEVAAVVKLCQEHEVAVVPSGGRTGLAAGAVASQSELVLSLQRLNQVLHVDPVDMSIRCQAGVTTEALQAAASQAGLFFGLDLAAKGSSHIGGNVATNAGGTKFIRYGGAREQVLGLEVVVANGDILNLNGNLRKNNTGYDLRHLFIGSEGTLGVITEVTCRLVPPPKNLQLICFAVRSFSSIPKILELVNQRRLTVTAFEFFTQQAHEIVLRHHPSLRTPFADKAEFYVLIEIEGEPELASQLEQFLEKAFEEKLVADGVLASSLAEFQELWALRERISESLAAEGHIHKNDVSVAVAHLDGFITKIQTIVNNTQENIKLILFGHIGDGNVHINYLGKKSLSQDEFFQRAKALEKDVFSLISEFSGSISAEHGIGMLKRDDLSLSCSHTEISLMKQIKDVFDPKGIMNPGKIFP